MSKLEVPSTRKNKLDLRGLTLSDLSKIVTEMNEPNYRADQIMSWIYKQGVESFKEMTNLSLSFRTLLSKHTSLNSFPLIHQSKSRHGPTIKYLFDLGA